MNLNNGIHKIMCIIIICKISIVCPCDHAWDSTVDASFSYLATVEILNSGVILRRGEEGMYSHPIPFNPPL